MRAFIGKGIRGLIALAGMGLYHLGLAKVIIRRSPDRVRTLLYHAIDNQPNPHVDGLNVSTTTAALAAHLDYAKKHYSVISEDELTTGRHGECPLTITFDDGYKSVEEQAVPLLKDYDLPATIYLIGSAVTGSHVWVNQLMHAINTQPKALRGILKDYPELENLRLNRVVPYVQGHFSPSAIELLMFRMEQELPEQYSSAGLFSDEEGVRRMRNKGMSFGFHTRDHYNLQNCSASMIERQLNPRFIAHLLNSNTFAYPFGLFSREAVRQLDSYGYDRLMTVNDCSKESARFHQGRSEIRARTAAGMFAQLEVVEPVMTRLHAAYRVLKQPIHLADISRLLSTH